MTTIKELVTQFSSDAGAEKAALRRKDFEQHVAQLAKSPAGWHGPNDIQSLAGLEGTFQWFEDPTNPAVITFKFAPGHVGSQGTYQLIGGKASESGEFGCAPNNPAVGWAFIVLAPKNQPPRAIDVAGLLTNSAWVISVALLNSVSDAGPIYPPFSAIRLLV